MRKFVAMQDAFTDRTYYVWYDENLQPLSLVSIAPPWLNNEIGKSCLPLGTYILNPYPSPTKIPAQVYEFQNTAPRENCELHVANFAFQLDGCMAPGLDFAMMTFKGDASRYPGIISGKQYPGVVSSGIALDKIKTLTNYQPFQLTIK